MVSGIEKIFNNVIQNNFHALKKIAVAVSGGSDSMALAVLLKQYSTLNTDFEITVLTVDHKLRDESENEAIFVKKYCKKVLTLPTEILEWNEKKPDSNIQHHARNSRYKLLIDYCKNNNIKYLFTAHHMDDLCETFILNLERGSGIDGLTSLKMISKKNEINLVRPLLNFSKNELQNYLLKKEVPWIEDTSNNNTKYKRNFYRKLINDIPDNEIFKKRVKLAHHHLLNCKKSIDFYTNQAFKTECIVNKLGYVEINLENLFKNHDEEIIKRTIIKALEIASGNIYKPRYSNFLKLFDNLKTQKIVKCTLHYCNIIKKNSNLLIFKERMKIPTKTTLISSKNFAWDKRFTITAPNEKEKFYIKNLDENYLKHIIIKDKLPDKRILFTLPVIFNEKKFFIENLNYKHKKDC